MENTNWITDLKNLTHKAKCEIEPYDTQSITNTFNKIVKALDDENSTLRKGIEKQAKNGKLRYADRLSNYETLNSYIHTEMDKYQLRDLLDKKYRGIYTTISFDDFVFYWTLYKDEKEDTWISHIKDLTKTAVEEEESFNKYCIKETFNKIVEALDDENSTLRKEIEKRAQKGETKFVDRLSKYETPNSDIQNNYDRAELDCQLARKYRGLNFSTTDGDDNLTIDWNWIK